MSHKQNEEFEEMKKEAEEEMDKSIVALAQEIIEAARAIQAINIINLK